MQIDPKPVRSVVAPVTAIVLGFIALYAVTVVESTADTPVYVSHILEYQQNGRAALLWEFGHLLWRPAGYVLWRALQPALTGWSGDNASLEITAVLMGLNFLTGIALAILCFFLCHALGLSDRVALAVTTGFMLVSTILRYVHSGMSYNPGLAFQMAALLCLLWPAPTTSRRNLLAMLGGVALALSFTLWFPYVLTVPSILLAGLIGRRAVGQPEPGWPRSRFGATAIAAATSAVLGIALFCMGAGLNHYFSYASLKGWVVNSGHGVAEENRLVRLPTGITRSFVVFGDQGISMKRFVLGDPYAPVHLPDLLPAMAKVILVFSELTLVVIWLARQRKGWPALAILISAFAPAIGFSILLFEPSEPARLEPAYPALLVALCALLTLPQAAKFARPSLAFLAAIIAVINLWSFGWILRAESAKVAERAELVHEHAAPHGIGILLSFRDPVSGFVQKEPFHPLNRPDSLPLYHVIEPGNVRMATWRRDVSCRILQSWSDRGEAWLSDRLRASRPRPEWDFAEHDDSRVKWADLPTFFNVLEIDAHAGGEDGFSRIAETPRNAQQLRSSCEESPGSSKP